MSGVQDLFVIDNLPPDADPVYKFEFPTAIKAIEAGQGVVSVSTENHYYVHLMDVGSSGILCHKPDNLNHLITPKVIEALVLEEVNSHPVSVISFQTLITPDRKYCCSLSWKAKHFNLLKQRDIDRNFIVLSGLKHNEIIHCIEKARFGILALSESDRTFGAFLQYGSAYKGLIV